MPEPRSLSLIFFLLRSLLPLYTPGAFFFGIAACFDVWPRVEVKIRVAHAS